MWFYITIAFLLLHNQKLVELEATSDIKAQFLLLLISLFFCILDVHVS
jgi:hypothetical protein